MVPDLIDAGATVVLECEPRLVPVFHRSFPGVTCIARESPLAPETTVAGIDYQSPSGDLGRWVRLDLDTFPEGRPHLVADGERAKALGARYRNGTDGLLVGIAWISKNLEIGRDKSMSLMDWRPLADIPGIRFVDLQYGDTGEERDAFEKETGVAVHHDDGINQMADLDAFAAQVAAMDQVISVSNTTVHISGALGVPTWVLLNTLPLCVWMLERDDSPWYPSVRLFW